MADPSVPRLLDIPGAADYLATSERHVRALIYRREIPYHKVGQLVRISRADLDTYLERNRVPSGGAA